MPVNRKTLLPAQTTVRVHQHTGKTTASLLDKVEHLLVIVPEKPPAAVWKQFPEGARIQALRSRRQAKGPVSARLHNSANTGVTVASAGTDDSAFAQLTLAGKLAAQACADNPASIAVLVAGCENAQAQSLYAALVLALQAHAFTMPAFNSEKKPQPRLRTIKLVGLPQRVDLDRVQAESAAVNLARWLTALPPNLLDAKGYRRAITALAKDQPWQCDFLDEKKLKRKGAGAFLAVAQGNATRDAGIMHIRYRPKGTPKNAQPLVSLVGKGIVFDTGGTNLKPFKAMLDMHCDMAGSAVALAALAALTEMDYPEPVDCWLAITENRLSAKAYKSRDIVTASNGTTIEVIHTDAEGRMALADTLALAGETKPGAIIDFATLTGTCVSALTDRYSGAFSNRSDLNPALIDAGVACGERVWPFPMDEDFDAEISSDVADVLQCAASGGGDHIQAARFLQRFVPDDVNWVHLDLSAATRTGGLAQVGTEITGFGVRYALNLILDQHEQLLQPAGQ
ncbi:MAG: leucyl aminopeptidase family protein [Gammaproteobacteria bacterium]|nr:leucyl aminopeptidase family protein [Gammaproteobacteria bacterium]